MAKQLKNRKGVLLTLGITFLALVILALATLILRNAESSEDRLVELGGMDRVYNLGSSVQKSLADAYFPLSGVKLKTTNDTIFIATNMHEYLEDKNNIYIYKAISGIFANDYVNASSRGRVVIGGTDPYPKLFFYDPLGTIQLFFEPAVYNYLFTGMKLEFNEDPPYPLFSINDDSSQHYKVKTSFQMFATNLTLNPAYTSDKSPEKYIFHIKSEERRGIINWTSEQNNGWCKDCVGCGGCTPEHERFHSTTEPEQAVIINITIEGPCHCAEGGTEIVQSIESPKNKVLLYNQEQYGFPQVIYIENLSEEYDPEYTHLRTDKKPSIRFANVIDNEFKHPILGSIPVSFSFAIVLNYGVDLYTEITAISNTTYTEVYSSENVTTQVKEFNMRRSQFARYG